MRYRKPVLAERGHLFSKEADYFFFFPPTWRRSRSCGVPRDPAAGWGAEQFPPDCSPGPDSAATVASVNAGNEMLRKEIPEN